MLSRIARWDSSRGKGQDVQTAAMFESSGTCKFMAVMTIWRPERCKPAILEAVMNPKSILVAAPVYSFPRIMNGGKPLLQLDLDV
ncbi:hypothetical protein ZWY2020_041142 [Hordeum vulgare]|nr:hypothetical protein ZWY2020_041142 [Hordeum vulgare]